MLWRACHHEFRFPAPPLVMGVVNATPDSFSDGGLYLDAGRAVAHGLELVRAGAGLLDVGGESTRPGATPVPEDEELRRVLPVVKELSRSAGVPISVDTLKPRVAAAALEAGATIVNDVGATLADPAMARLLAGSGAGYVAMHMQGTPATMQVDPHYDDVVGEIRAFFAATLDRLAAAGVRPEQVVLDPGIGFGKRLGHNLELLARLPAFKELGRPLLIGVSRKSFIGQLTGAPVEARLPGSVAATCQAVAGGASIVRTHDVAETVQALRVWEAIEGARVPRPAVHDNNP